MEEFHGSAGAPTGPEDHEAPAPLDAGRLGGFVCELQRKRFDGVLHLRCGEQTASIGFREGTPVTFDDPTPGHTLAEQLIERGQLTRAQCNSVLARMTDGLVEDESIAFFEHAVELGFLTDDEANVELSSRIRARLIQLFAFRNCETTLEPGAAALLGRREFPQSLGAILYMGVRTFYDEDYLTSLHPDPANTYVRLTAAATSIAQHFELDDDELQLLRRIRPEHSLSELFQDPRVDRVHVLALVLLMRLSQLCEVSRGPFAPATPRRSPSTKLREANETNPLRGGKAGGRASLRESSESAPMRGRSGSQVGPLPEAPGANALRGRSGSHVGPLPEAPGASLRGKSGSHVGPLPEAPGASLRGKSGSHVGPLPDAPTTPPPPGMIGAHVGTLPDAATAPPRGKTGSQVGPLPDAATAPPRGKTGSRVGPLPDAATAPPRRKAGSHVDALHDAVTTPPRGKSGSHVDPVDDAATTPPPGRPGSYVGPLPDDAAATSARGSRGGPASRLDPRHDAVTTPPRGRPGSHVGPLPEDLAATSSRGGRVHDAVTAPPRARPGSLPDAVTTPPRGRPGSYVGPLPEDVAATTPRGRPGAHVEPQHEASAARPARGKAGSHVGPLPEDVAATTPRGRPGAHVEPQHEASAARPARGKAGSHVGPLPEAAATTPPRATSGSYASTLPEPQAPAPLRSRTGSSVGPLPEAFEPDPLHPDIDPLIEASEARGKAASSVGPLPDPPPPPPVAKGGVDATQEALLEAAARTARMRRSVPSSRRNSKQAEPLPSAAISSGREPSETGNRPAQAGAAAASGGRAPSPPTQGGPANTNQSGKSMQPADPRADYAKAHLKELIARRKQAANAPEQTGPNARDTGRELREARSLLHAQNYARAEKILAGLLEVEPQNEVWKTYHVWARWRAQPDAGEQSLDELQELAKKLLSMPEHGAFAAYVLGHIFFHTKRDDLAEKFFKRAHAADRTNKDAERHILIIERRKQAAAEGGAGSNRKLFGIQLPSSKPKT